MKTSCIRHPERENLIIVRKWQVVFCEGDTCAAALISFFEYWHNIKLEQYEKEENPAKRSLLQWHTEEDLEHGVAETGYEERKEELNGKIQVLRKAIEVLDLK